MFVADHFGDAGGIQPFQAFDAGAFVALQDAVDEVRRLVVAERLLAELCSKRTHHRINDLGCTLRFA